MRSLVLAFALLLISPHAVHADSWTDGPEGRRRIHHLIAVVTGAAIYAGSVALESSTGPTACRWCAVPDFDEDVREHLVWSSPTRAAELSTASGYVAAPLAAVGLTLLSAYSDDDLHWARVIDDELPILEAATYSALLDQAVKLTAARERPYAALATSPINPTVDSHLSFFSGHTTLGFALAVSAGEVAHRRHSRYEPAIWAIGLTLAATTGYLRIAADQHFASDVLVGAAVGALAGHFVPRLLGTLPRSIVIAPTTDGIAIAGQW